MKKERKIKKDNLKSLPQSPGVYLFYDKKDKLLYIGKANNLKERVKNHFSQPNYKDNLFIESVEKIGYIPLSSEVEALILESQLIKKYQPKFNILFRDDKKYFYVAITNENWPRVFITHQPIIKEIRNTKYEIRNKSKKVSNLEFRNSNFTYIGPFTDGTSLKETLKLLRKIFPFRTCKNFPKRPCLWYHLERCPAPCLLEKESKIRKELENQTKERQKKYKKNIKKLKEILEGKRNTVINTLKKEMKKMAEKEEFEKAAILRDKIIALEKVFSHKIIFDTKIKAEEKSEGISLKENLSLKKVPRRIEGYDVSNIQSKEMVGAMVVFELNKSGKYLPNKKEYRLFKIKTVKKQNDIACLKEIISRRITHKEWQMPDLIYIDGGKAQFNAVNKTIQLITKNSKQKNIPIISLAKKTNILYTNIFNNSISLDKLEKPAKMTILRIKDETHRFAIKYHRNLRKKNIFKNG